MSEEHLARHCAPTLAGIKAGKIFSCPVESRAEFDAQTARLQKLLAAKNLKMRVLRIAGERALVYVYCPKRLVREMSDGRVVRFMQTLGYTPENIEGCIDRLGDRICSAEDFPHEIGLFLSYPFRDVKAFIENKGKNYKLAGVWKVYFDEPAAIRTFEQYRRCTVFYADLVKQGRSLL